MTTHSQPKQANWQPVEQLALHACEGIQGTNVANLLKIAHIPRSSSNCRSIHHIPAHNARQTPNTQLMMAARLLSETSPQYDRVASRLLLQNLTTEVLSTLAGHGHNATTPILNSEKHHLNYQKGFVHYIEKGIELDLIHPDVATYNLPQLAKKLVPNLDANMTYMELQNLSSQRLLRHEGSCFEFPQYAFMRIAIALAKKENRCEIRAAEIYRLLSARSYARITSKTMAEGTTTQSLSKLISLKEPSYLTLVK